MLWVTYDKKRPDWFCSKLGNLHEKIQLDLSQREKKGGIIASHFWAQKMQVHLQRADLTSEVAMLRYREKEAELRGCHEYLLKYLQGKNMDNNLVC
jgi:hypothetical protein